MSSASTTRTIKFLSKAGTYAAVIMCPDGDLYQEYEGSTSQVTGIYPNFEATKPILYFVCTSSRAAESVATPDAINFYFNGTLIQWNGDTSTGTFAGMFKRVYPNVAAGNLYYGLQILKNIAEAALFAPAVIKMVATISYGTQTDNIEASYNIPIQKATGNGIRVTIVSPDGKNFVINDKGGSCQLKAMAYQKGVEINPTQNSLSYRWEQQDPLANLEYIGDKANKWRVGWRELSETTQTITVKDTDINCFGDFRVTIFRGAEELSKDIQGVMDASDPLQIDPHPSPEDETITEDITGNGEVTYTPVVVKRGTSTKALDTTFYFVVKDAVGNILNIPSLGQAKTSETVVRAQCVQAGGDVSITITSKD